MLTRLSRSSPARRWRRGSLSISGSRTSMLSNDIGKNYLTINVLTRGRRLKRSKETWKYFTVYVLGKKMQRRFAPPLDSACAAGLEYQEDQNNASRSSLPSDSVPLKTSSRSLFDLSVNNISRSEVLRYRLGFFFQYSEGCVALSFPSRPMSVLA